MNLLIDKLSKNQWALSLVLLKDLYEIIKEVPIWNWAAIKLNMPSIMNELIDFVLMAIMVLIIIALLKQYKRQKEDFEIMREITRQVNLVRAQAIYLANQSFNDLDLMNSKYRSHLLDEYKNVQDRLQKSHPDWSPADIEFILSDYYGFTKQSLTDEYNPDQQ